MHIFVNASKGAIEVTRLGIKDNVNIVSSADVNDITAALLGLFKGVKFPSVKPSEVGIYCSSSMDYPLEYGFIERGDAHRLFDTAWDRAVKIYDGVYTYDESKYLNKAYTK